MYTLDANIFIRDLDSREPDHAVCHELLEILDIRAIPIITPLLVLAEVAGTVSRVRRDPIAARLAVELLQSRSGIKLILMDTALAALAADIAADCGLRGADALYVAVARQHHCTLVTLDREPRERTTTLIRALTPTEALAELTPQM